MRTLSTLLLITITSLSFGQDWALINPAYRYNYANDGTDTISNQVFVTDIDTLGVDNFRYELNRVVELCDTCEVLSGSLTVFPNAPQWLGGEVRVLNEVWHFRGEGSRVLFPHADEGFTWLFDTLSGVWAEMGVTLQTSTFGSVDEHRTILLDNGGALLISRDHGVLQWESGHDLVGINGPQLGITIPALADFFPYANGDMVEYEKFYGGCDGLGGCEGRATEFKFTVDQGIPTDSSTIWSGWMTSHHIWSFQTGGPGGPNNFVHSYMNGPGEWISGLPELPWAELLRSYPGQLIERRHFLDPEFPAPNYCIAQHRLDELGRYVIGCRAFPQDQNNTFGHFFHSDEQVLNENDPIQLWGPEDWNDVGGPSAGVNFTKDLGLVSFTGNYFERTEHYLMRGLLLQGDTVHGSLTDDSIILRITPSQTNANISITPNPASDRISLVGLPTGVKVIQIRDLTGRTHQTIRSNGQGRVEIDVSRLGSGLYLVKADDMQPHRLVISR